MQTLLENWPSCPRLSIQKSIWRVKARATDLTNLLLSRPKFWVIKQKQTKIEANIPPGFVDSLTPAVSPPLPLLQATVQPPSSSATMVTLSVNPLAFLPEGMTIDQGPADRKVRIDLVVSSPAPLQHDKVSIAETNRFIPIHLRAQMRSDIRDMLNEAGHIVSAFDDHPFGIGSFTFTHTLAADTVIGLTFALDEDTNITFVKHNEARNMRLTTFGREVWILFLGFPLDYQTTAYICSAVEDFGLLTVWDNLRGNNKCRGDDLWGMPRAVLSAGWRPRNLHGSRTRRPAPPEGPAAPAAG
jgi:hypothetical protein